MSLLQDQLVELQGVIGKTLEYFKELEHATHLLNHPGESLFLQTDFLYMVERVDVCIEFLKSHVWSTLSHVWRYGSHPRDHEITKKRMYTSCDSSNA